MKNLSLFLLASVFSHLSYASCPDRSLGEVELDCPWAEFARNFVNEATLREKLPSLTHQIEADAANEGYKSIWGHSLNYDEYVKDLIVAPTILKSLYAMMQIMPPTDLESSPKVALQHAGLEHTYGYLFSVLRTSFGYKRARWVVGDIERGFGLEPHLLGPNCSKGTLFSNLTYFLGSIAFRGHPERLRLLEDGAQVVAPFLTEIDFDSVPVERLEESLLLVGPVKVVLRTDIVKFLKPSLSSNDALLIYSVLDSRESQPKLITAFPVSQGFVNGLFESSRLGEDQNITTRYNAHVEGLTGNSAVGTRLRVPNKTPL